MRLNRRRALTVLAGSAMFLAGPGRPVGAAEPEPIILGAKSSGRDWFGRLEVQMYLASAATQIRAHIVSKVDDSVLAVVAGFDQTSDSIWQSSDLIQMPALGYYRVDVEVWTAGGSYARRDNAGELSYVATTMVGDLTYTPHEPTREHRMITATGQLQAKHPGTLAATPVPGGELVFEVNHERNADDYTVTVTTGADGRFSLDLPMTNQAALTIKPTGDPRTYRIDGTWISRRVDTVRAQTRLTATTGAGNVDLGQPTAISGVLEVLESGQWQPLTGRVVTVTPGHDWSQAKDLTTDADGRFATELMLTHSIGVVCEFWPYNNNDDYVAAAQTTFGAAVRLPISFDSYFIVRKSQNPSKPTAWEIVGYLRGVGTDFPVHIQTGTSPDGPWTTVATTTTTNLTYGNGNQFNTEIEVIGNRYIRAFSPASLTTQAAASNAVFVRQLTTPRRTTMPGRLPTPRR